MLARCLELVSDEPQVEQEDPEVVPGALRVEGPLAARCRPAVQRLGRHGQDQLDVGFHLPRVERPFEPTELDRAPVPDVVQVHPVVAGAVVVLRLPVVVAVPNVVELVPGPGTAALDLGNEVVAHRLAVVAAACLVHAQSGENERFLLVDDLGEVREGPAVKGCGVDVDVDAATVVHLGSAGPQRPDDLLEDGDVLVGQDGAHHLGPQVDRHIDERAVGYHFPDPSMVVGDFPGVEAARAADVADLAAHHRLDRLGDPLARPFDRLDLDSEVDPA